RRRLAAADKPIVLCVGRFGAVKNQRLAVEAFAASKRLRDGARLVFAGDGTHEDAVRALARERAVSDVVRFLGHRSDVAEIMAAADVLLMTSHNEAMPLVALEAMHAGLPIVTVPWLGSAELFEDGKTALITGDYAPERVAAALEEALEDRACALERARAAREVALQQYTLSACAKRHAELYRSLLE
ncbi:MAG: glycosyltransferase family 4 protein, partial [Candidatus Eremiobacteraeota bacterium]|nr:glycosyltransferase family 4 protein [Candidatus Eremiobacteraeota bacterium]